MSDADSAPLDGRMIGHEAYLAMRELIEDPNTDLVVLRALWTMSTLGLDPGAAIQNCALQAGDLQARMQIIHGFDVNSQVPKDKE